MLLHLILTLLHLILTLLYYCPKIKYNILKYIILDKYNTKQKLSLQLLDSHVACMGIT